MGRVGWDNKIIGMSQRHQKGFMPWDRSGNRLLVKSELGRNRPTNYDIPHSNFVYGKLTFEDPEKANELMYKWKEHQISPNANHLKQKDFKQTNKAALKSLLHTSSQFSQHRQTNTLFRPAKEGSTLIPIRLPEPNHAYGKPLDLEDPVKLVIANNYGEDDQTVRHTFYQQQSAKSLGGKRKLSCHITKNHNLVKEATAKRLQKFEWEQKKLLWKLSKFADVDFKVETRWPQVKK